MVNVKEKWDVKDLPAQLKVTEYNMGEFVMSLFNAYEKGYVPFDITCARRMGTLIEANLVQASEKKRIKRETREKKEEEIAERKELKRLASEKEEEEAVEKPVEVNEDGKEILDDKTQLMLDIDWELLDKKAIEGEKDFIFDTASKHGITLKKTLKPENMVKSFKNKILLT